MQRPPPLSLGDLARLPPASTPDGAMAPTGTWVDPFTADEDGTAASAADGAAATASPSAVNGVPPLLIGMPPDKLAATYHRLLQTARYEEDQGVQVSWAPVVPLEVTIAWLLECAEKTLRTRPDLLTAFKAAVDTPYSYWELAKEVATSP